MITIQVVNSVLRPSKISLLPRMGYCPKLAYLCFPRWGLIWILKVGKTDPPPSHWKVWTWFVTKVNFRNDHYWESIKMKQFYTLEHLLFLFCYIEPFKKLFRLQLVSRIKGIYCRSKLVAYKKLKSNISVPMNIDNPLKFLGLTTYILVVYFETWLWVYIALQC